MASSRKRKASPSAPRPPRVPKRAQPSLRTGGVELAARPGTDRCVDELKSQWVAAEWQALSEVDVSQFSAAERVVAAMLSASACMQLGSYREGRTRLEWALAAGLSRREAARWLATGLSNTLARARACAGHDELALAHFRAAVAGVAPAPEAKDAVMRRSLRELGRLGLLTQAAELMEGELAGAQERDGVGAARLRMLATELELFKHELAIAQRRGQLYGGAGADSLQRHNSVEDRNALERLSVSQLGQDLWVLERSGYKRGGYFVEFGATDGVLLSNTWLLEQAFGWQGICVEPNPRLFEKLKGHRRCQVSDRYIGGRSGELVEFILADAFGTAVQYADQDEHGAKRDAYRRAGEVISLTSVSLDALLEDYGAPRDIDYLSVDTEGSELEILSSFPFDKWNVRFITVEHNFGAQREGLRTLLEGHGYTCTPCEWDDWYEKRDGQDDD